MTDPKMLSDQSTGAHMIDALKLYEMDKSKPLTIKECPRATECAISGCPLDQHSWCVALPGGKLACPSCAGDKGWEVR